jgi:hypothetical protein
VKRLYFSFVIVIAIILLMTNLGTSTDEQPTDGFATIPDTSILALSNSVTSSQLAFGLNRGDVFKIMKADTVTIVPVQGATQVSVNHGLSGIPTVIAFLQAAGNYYPLPFDSITYNGWFRYYYY